MYKLKEFGALAGFKISKQKTMMLTNKTKHEDIRSTRINEMGFKTEKKVKILQ